MRQFKVSPMSSIECAEWTDDELKGKNVKELKHYYDLHVDKNVYKSFYVWVKTMGVFSTEDIMCANCGWMVNHPGYDPIGYPAREDNITPTRYDGYDESIENQRIEEGAPDDSEYDWDAGLFAKPDDPDIYWDKDTQSYNIYWDGNTYRKMEYIESGKLMDTFSRWFGNFVDSRRRIHKVAAKLATNDEDEAADELEDMVRDIDENYESFQFGGKSNNPISLFKQGYEFLN